MFRTGDKVRIKSGLESGSTVGGFRVAPVMAKLGGTEAYIRRRRENGSYEISVAWSGYNWSDEMLIAVENKTDGKVFRKSFDTGAVRDTDETKGRCDLMPLNMVGLVLAGKRMYVDLSGNKVLQKIEYIKKTSEEKREEKLFPIAAVLEFLETQEVKRHPAEIMLDLSIHFKEGAERYGIDNWKKGIPYSSYIDSGVRHYLKHLAGMTDEKHDIAFVWNMVCLAWTIENMPQMNDLIKGGSDELEKTSSGRIEKL